MATKPRGGGVGLKALVPGPLRSSASHKQLAVISPKIAIARHIKIVLNRSNDSKTLVFWNWVNRKGGGTQVYKKQGFHIGNRIQKLQIESYLWHLSVVPWLDDGTIYISRNFALFPVKISTFRGITGESHDY